MSVSACVRWGRIWSPATTEWTNKAILGGEYLGWDGMGYSVVCGYWCRHRSKDCSIAHHLPLWAFAPGSAGFIPEKNLPPSPLIQFPALSLTSFYRISLPSCPSTWYGSQWQRGDLPQNNNFAACSDHCPRFSWAYCLAEWQWPRESVDRTVGGIHLDHHPLPHRQRVARWREKDLRPYATVCASASCCYTILGRGSSSSAAVVGAEEDVRVNMTPAAAAVANWVMARCAYLHI